MGISSSLNASVAGLQVNAQRLAGISDNIANSETFGYKRAETSFSSLVNRGNSPSSYNAGGVRATTSREISVQGSLIGTGNATDLTINGRGMLPVTTVEERAETPAGRPLALTTTGSFTRDDEGFLRTTGGLQLLGWPTDASGEIGSVSRESALDLMPVKLSGFDFAPSATTRAEMSVNLPTTAAAGETYSMSLEYFDALGTAHTIGIDYTAVNPSVGTWTLEMTDRTTGALIGEADLTFATSGIAAGGIDSVAATTGTYDPTTGALTVNGVSGAIEITIGSPGSTANLTQYASEFAPVNLTKNGSALGFLKQVEMTGGGVLEGVYDTGFRRPLYRIPVANVSNPEGLTSLDDQAYQVSNSSGAVYFWDSGAGPTGSITGYTLEESTTDITEELTQLIETQRAYSSNAKIVQTVDEMLQETTNLKR